MQVILKQDVKGSGKTGDVIKVSDGYAKNFLIKKGFAVQATVKELNELNSKKASESFREQEKIDELKAMAQAIEGKTVTVNAKAGQEGKIFGKVTSKTISEEIKAQYGVDIDKRKITTETDIKAFGSYEIKVKLHPQVVASFTCKVCEG